MGLEFVPVELAVGAFAVLVDDVYLLVCVRGAQTHSIMFAKQMRYHCTSRAQNYQNSIQLNRIQGKYMLENKKQTRL